jgi:hypothetical protein
MASDIDELAVSLVTADPDEVQVAGPSLEQRNQRASVIVVQPSSTENRVGTVELEITNEAQTDQDSHDSLAESSGPLSPILIRGRRRRPRGMVYSRIYLLFFQNCHIFQNLDEDNDDEETEDGGPPSRKSKSDSAGGFIPEKEDKSAVDDEEDGQVSLLLTRSFVKILFVI